MLTIYLQPFWSIDMHLEKLSNTASNNIPEHKIQDYSIVIFPGDLGNDPLESVLVVKLRWSYHLTWSWKHLWVNSEVFDANLIHRRWRCLLPCKNKMCHISWHQKIQSTRLKIQENTLLLRSFQLTDLVLRKLELEIAKKRQYNGMIYINVT